MPLSPLFALATPPGAAHALVDAQGRPIYPHYGAGLRLVATPTLPYANPVAYDPAFRQWQTRQSADFYAATPEDWESRFTNPMHPDATFAENVFGQARTPPQSTAAHAVDPSLVYSYEEVAGLHLLGTPPDGVSAQWRFSVDYEYLLRTDILTLLPNIPLGARPLRIRIPARVTFSAAVTTADAPVPSSWTFWTTGDPAWLEGIPNAWDRASNALLPFSRSRGTGAASTSPTYPLPLAIPLTNGQQTVLEEDYEIVVDVGMLGATSGAVARRVTDAVPTFQSALSQLLWQLWVTKTDTTGAANFEARMSVSATVLLDHAAAYPAER